MQVWRAENRRSSAARILAHAFRVGIAGGLSLASACGGHTRYQLMELSLKTDTHSQEIGALKTRMEKLEDANEQLRTKILERLK